MEDRPLGRRWICRLPAKPNKSSEPSGPEAATQGPSSQEKPRCCSGGGLESMGLPSGAHDPPPPSWPTNGAGGHSWHKGSGGRRMPLSHCGLTQRLGVKSELGVRPQPCLGVNLCKAPGRGEAPDGGRVSQSCTESPSSTGGLVGIVYSFGKPLWNKQMNGQVGRMREMKKCHLRIFLIPA